MASRTAQAALAFLAALLWTTPAAAQQPTPCVKRADFLAHLSAKYSESTVALGLTASGNVLEVIASESGSWTIIVTMPNGVSCGIASGQNWEVVKQPPKGPQT